MDIEITERNDNPLLDRQELKLVLNHPKSATPRRMDVRKRLAEQLDVKAELIIIDHLRNRYGAPQSRGYAKVYANAEALRATETKPLLKRHGLGGGE